MKKMISRFCTYGLCAVLTGATLCGCNHKKTQTTNTNVSRKDTVNQSAFVSELKAKHTETEKVTYAEPMYNVQKDHVFTYSNVPEAFWDTQEYDCFSVYYDSKLKQPVDISIESDYDAKTVSIKPNLTFSIDEEEGSLTDDGTWGSRSKFWLVQNIDLKTGKMLDKPIVTVFTTKEDMNTPTLEQTIGENGCYSLSWEPVEGADHYEVYRYAASTDSAFLELTTEKTSCEYDEFKSASDSEKHFKETYKNTEIDVNTKWLMNSMLDKEDGYFVIARTNDKTHSGLSNTCMVSDIASQIPYMASDNFKDEYEGDTALDLPAYVDIEMLDGSIGKFLIEYHDAKITLLDDKSIVIECKIKNLPINMQAIKLKGMDWDAFLEDKESLTEREDKLTAKSATTEKNINIPYLPDSDTKTPDENTPSATEPTEETMSPDETEPAEETISPDETEPEETIPPDATEPEETISPNETDIPETEQPDSSTSKPLNDDNTNDKTLSLPDSIQKTVTAHSALSEWIAINMLNHKEEIPLDDFAESSDTEYLKDAFLEAYTQNPLIGIMSKMNYDYNNNCLLIEYVLSEEETKHMQEESLKKAAEIADSIIKDGMSDYEKEEAINHYICENGTYNDEIMDYINKDGTIDNEATKQFAQSFTPYGILVENLGVCESYSEAFLLLAKEAGLDAVIETGTLDGVNHEWNRVKIDDNWYTIDTTNNDNEVLPNIYFNLPDDLAASRLLQDNNAFLDEYISEYAAEGMDNEYYTKNNLYTEDAAKAADLLAKNISENNVAAVRMPEDLDPDTIKEVAQNAVKQAKVSSAKYYSCAGVISLVKE